MAHFTLKFRTNGGEVFFETDFTVHELIPLVRQVLRSLGTRPDLAADLPSYRAIVTPRYEGQPRTKADVTRNIVYPAPRPVVTDSTPDSATDLLQISEQDLEVYAPVSYLEELLAYYNPGSSHLCLDCPERQRCPGSGRQTENDVANWIALDPEAPRTNEPLVFFTLRIESRERKILFENDFPIGAFDFLVKMTARLLEGKDSVRLPASRTFQGEVIARYEGQPRIDPILSPERRPRMLVRTDPPAPARRAAAAEPPRRLVDWDSLEERGGAAPDIDIKVLPSEPEPLDHKPTPAPEHTQEVDLVGDPPLLIFLSRSVQQALEAAKKDLRSEIGGVLVGEAYLRPTDDRQWVEIVGLLPAINGSGEAASLTLDFNLLQERLNREFPGHRTVGWYRFHLLGNQRVSVYYDRHLYMAGVGERLLLLKEESFMHRNFFPQPWHVGLVIDGIEGTSRFYHRRGDEIVGCDGYMLFDE
jgi:hypothetical protein